MKGGTLAWGFRVRSGWAAAALVELASGAPRVLRLARLELADPELPETRQPYHADFGTLETDAAELARRRRRIRSCAAASLARLLEEDSGRRARGAGLVVGSLADPAAIANPHIRAHALEGRLFRSVLEEPLARRSLPTSLFLERGLYGRAAEVLRRGEERVRREVTRLPRPSGPWRADHKLAALAAWLVLVG